MGKFLGGHILLAYSRIEAIFILTILVFEGFHDEIYFVATRCTQQKLFKENEGWVNANRLWLEAASLYN